MDTKSFHLENQPAPEGILKGVASKGEFHENAFNDAETTQAASEALLAGVVLTGEIHLEKQCASEGILKGVIPEGEFYEASAELVRQLVIRLMNF